jgi:protein TonB
MRMRLPESARRRERRLGGIATSVTAHGVVILLVVYATAHGEPASPPEEAPVRVIYNAPTPPALPRTEQRAGTGSNAGGSTAPASPVLPPITAPTLPPLMLPVGDIPLPSAPVVGNVTSGDDFRDGRALLGTTPGGGAGRRGGDPFGALEVDRAATPRTRVEPRYPEVLRERGIAGAVVVRFVVDSAGRIAAGSLQVLEATDPRFADAVREALARTRFVPAEAAGRRVAQLVEQRFEFRLR